MKHTKRILCALLTLCMVVCAIPAFCFTAVAEEAEEINLAAEYAVSMVLPTRDDKDVKAAFTDGVIDDTDAGYYTLSMGRWTEVDEQDEDGNMVKNTKPVEENPCYVEADLGQTMTITAISAGFLARGEVYDDMDRIYHWEAYATNDKDLPISEWTKIAEKVTNEIADGSGYKDTLETPIEARYVRLYGTYNNANRQIHMNEFGIWGPEPVIIPEEPKPALTTSEPTNIAYNSGVYITKCDDMDYDWLTETLTDGLVDNEDGGDYWSAVGDAVENPIENESDAWFQADLGKAYVVDAVTVIERIASGDRILDYYTNWEVYGSLDADAPLDTWVKLGEKKNEEKVNVEGYTAEFEQPAAVRYLRIYGTKSTTDQYYDFQLCEIKIWTGMKSMLNYEGYQVGGEEGNDIRFAASINNPDLVSVGMKIEVASAKKVFNCEDNKVCKTLQFVNEYGETKNAVSVDPEAGAEYVVDAEYLYGFVITGVASGTYEFVITPMATMADGTVYQGETVTVEITI